MFCQGLSLRYISAMTVFMLSIAACTHSPPITTELGKPQREYTYQAPIRIDDGWQVSSLAGEGVDEEIINDMMEAILAGKYPNTHSVLLVKNGKLILEEYFNGNKRDDLHYLASVTKSVTSILIGISLDEDLLTDVDQNVSDWFKDYQGTKWISKKYNINIKHLLSMTAGIEWDENRSASDPKLDYSAMHRDGDWIRYVFNKELVSSPGKEFNYNGGLSVLLGEIIKRASGLNAEKFSEKHLFGPLGISHYRWLKYNDGSIDTGGGLLLRSRDMAKIGQIVLGNGKVEDKQIVSKQWIIESTKNHPVEKAHPLGSGYGYQWWLGEILIGSDKVKIVFAQGRGGQCIFVIPKANAIVVVTSQLRDNDGGFFRPQVMMTEFVIPALFHQSPVAKIINVDQSKLQEYLGDYEHRWFNITASVMIKDNKLIVASPGLERIEFFPTSQTVFRGIIENIGAAELSFSKNENGIGDDMTMRIGFTYILFDKIK